MIYLALTALLSVICNWPIYLMIRADVEAFSPRRHPVPMFVGDVPYLPSSDPTGLI